jgi:hypothetical protein
MWHSVDRYLSDIFSMMDSDDAELDRRVAVVKLTPASVSQLDDMFRHLQMEVRRLANNDRSAEPDDKSWYAVLMGARPFEMELDSDTDIPWWRKGARPAPRKVRPHNGPAKGRDLAHRDFP